MSVLAASRFSLRSSCSCVRSASWQLPSKRSSNVPFTSVAPLGKHATSVRKQQQTTMAKGVQVGGSAWLTPMGLGRAQARTYRTLSWLAPGRVAENSGKIQASSNGGVGSNGAAMEGQNGSLEDDSLNGGYRLPPKEIADIVDAPPTPALSFSPQRDRILFLQRPSLTPVSELARPELKLAGLRIDGEINARSRMGYYTSMSICDVSEDGTRGEEKAISGIPEGAKINFTSWSDDGLHFCFTIRENSVDGDGNETRSGLSLWVADLTTLEARELLSPSTAVLNTVFESYSWINESTLIVSTVPKSHGPPPKRKLAPTGPIIQSNETGKVSQTRTYTDLLKDNHDEELFDYYATSQLLVLDLAGNVTPIGQPRIYTSIEPSPDSEFMLIAYVERPYSYVVPCGRFPLVVEVWRASGEGVGEKVRDVVRLPLAEDIPITFNSVRKGRRSIDWRSDKPATLYWAETQDGGDAKVEASPRDIVYTAPAVDDGSEPTVLAKTEQRFGGIQWQRDDQALLYESWYKTRNTKTWIFAPGNPSAPPRLLFDRSYEDVYSDPGSPFSRKTALDSGVLAEVVGGKADHARLLFSGAGATPEGDRPFLDLFDLETKETERVWQCGTEVYYESVVALMSDKKPELVEGRELGDLEPFKLDEMRFLMSRESQTEPPQYFLWTLKTDTWQQITDFPHPYPQLKGLSKEIIRYKRNDGVDLMGTLYLPPNYSAEKDGPLPLIMWAYPREFKSKDAAGQMRGSPNEFSGIGATSALLWLARGYAILDGPTMPIIGEGDQEANDKYVEQLVASAQAAVDEVVRRGVANPERIAVGGHSYGAFMTANLLAHCPHLFACGIARSGAYNRTLTPFGFQAEERTLWEAAETYMTMSPFMQANKIKKPLLLIHGEADNNTGTFPMQSERFFAALKGHGGNTRLVILPHESHGYRARESIMHMLWEMDRWMEKYCVAKPKGTEETSGKEEGEKVAAGVESEDRRVGRLKPMLEGKPISSL